MDKRFTVILAVLALVLLFLTPGGIEALFALVFIGMIPFTSYTIPPLIMLIIYIALIITGVRWIITQSLRIPNAAEYDSMAREKARARVAKKVGSPATAKPKRPRRRYQQTAEA